MKNATPQRARCFLKKAKAPRGAYTYLRKPVILIDDRTADKTIAPTFTPPALSACRDYGMPVRPSVYPMIDTRSHVILGIIVR
ncbi:hypothetical protein sphantq_02488 [Sphingobium sp. AntQ-1]|uniref:hypothetical protein n=1 Tax=Sphingobium sp. AntQ-1 TaxID=2930091 RepID=UPI00234E8882|nr:hypothetical protein [Sphingobium sp. AntQ-1]WCP14046.1 hypothetical protein sphantq_02488 [Sphingobium sp. AntQ-1]